MRVKPTGEAPGRRVGHSFDLVNSSLGAATGVLIWGKGGATYHTDALALRIRENAWTKPDLHGKAVVSRWRHASAALRDRQAVFITGGEDAQGNAVMDPQMLDTSSGAAGPVPHPHPHPPCRFPAALFALYRRAGAPVPLVLHSRLR